MYLKNERRIEALCMIMVLCLMIYAYTEWLMRNRLPRRKRIRFESKEKTNCKSYLKMDFL